MIQDKQKFGKFCDFFANLQKKINNTEYYNDFYDRFLSEPIGEAILGDIEEVRKIEKKMAEHKGPKSFDPTYLKILKATGTVTTDQTFDEYNHVKDMFGEEIISKYHESAIIHAYIASMISEQLKAKNTNVKISDSYKIFFPEIVENYRAIPEDHFYEQTSTVNIKNYSKCLDDTPYAFAHLTWESDSNKIIQTISNLGYGMLHDKYNSVLYNPINLVHQAHKVKTLDDLFKNK